MAGGPWAHLLVGSADAHGGADSPLAAASAYQASPATDQTSRRAQSGRGGGRSSRGGRGGRGGRGLQVIKECPICLDPMLPTERVEALPCGCSIFHSACIEGWLAKKRECPVCCFEVPTS